MPISRPKRRREVIGAALGLPFLFTAGRGQAAETALHDWFVPDLLGPARAEGGLTVYSSTNEQEGLPLWRVFEDATGIKVTYVRNSDPSLIGRIGIEARAGQQSWDLFNSPAIYALPSQFLTPLDLPEAAAIIPEAHGAGKRWFGCYGNYNTPAYNTKLVAAADMPKNYEGFLDHPEWAGKVAIDSTDREWLYAILKSRGEEAGRRLVKQLVAVLKPAVIDGHLALARAVAAGEYAVALNNYTMLTINQQLAGGPTDYWPLDPIGLFFGAVGVNPKAPHPNAARLGANFMLSREAQALATRTGRLPTRRDVMANPPDAIRRLTAVRSIPVDLTPEEGRRWQKDFHALMQAP